MKLRDRQLLADYMRKREFTQARLGRYAGVSRQFIYQLVSGRLDSCSRPVGQLIEEALDLLPGTLFVPMTSLDAGDTIPRRTTSGVAA
jgi:hypothetical protein